MLIAAAIITLSGLSVDAPPFTPMVPQPDYTAIMIEKSRDQEDTSVVVTHHAPWTRIDRSQGRSRSSEYYSAASGARMTVWGERSVTLERKIGSAPGVDFEARNTGERQISLNESCTVWDVWRRRQPVYGSNVSHLSCITDDGIALREKTLHGNDVLSSLEASRIERRPIASEQVQAPRALLAADWWDTDLPSFDGLSTPDHETVMQPSGTAPEGAKSIRTTRRLGPWQWLDEMVGRRCRLSITHDSHRIGLQYSSDKSGAPSRLTITRPDTIPDSSAHRLVSKTTDLNRSETILGESCRWFDMMPGVFDAGRRSCLTSDGIVLKEVLSGRGMDEQEWTAVRLTRRPIRLDEIKPPAELLDPHLWGLD